jgi:hypothetical protein
VLKLKKKNSGVKRLNENPWWLKTPVLLPTALATATNLAAGLAFAL